jgi:hypothetical protein
MDSEQARQSLYAGEDVQVINGHGTDGERLANFLVKSHQQSSATLNTNSRIWLS